MCHWYKRNILKHVSLIQKEYKIKHVSLIQKEYKIKHVLLVQKEYKLEYVSLIQNECKIKHVSLTQKEYTKAMLNTSSVMAVAPRCYISWSARSAAYQRRPSDGVNESCAGHPRTPLRGSQHGKWLEEGPALATIFRSDCRVIERLSLRLIVSVLWVGQ